MYPVDIVDNSTSIMKELKLFTDGGSRGNPGPSATGFVLTTMDDQVVAKSGVYIGVTTNNQAEYQALKLGLEKAAELQVRTVHVFMDSLLVINQMKGIFKIKNRDLWPIHAAIQGLVERFRQVTFTHIPRNLNRAADGMVNQTLDQHPGITQA
jgi:ribonuclease HI